MEINFIDSLDNDTGLCPSFKYTPFQQPNSCALRGKQLKKKEVLVQSCSFFPCFRYIDLDWILLSISSNFSEHTFSHRYILKPSCITLHDLRSSTFFSLYFWQCNILYCYFYFVININLTGFLVTARK